MSDLPTREEARQALDAEALLAEIHNVRGLGFSPARSMVVETLEEVAKAFVSGRLVEVGVCPTCNGDGRELDDASAAALARAIGVEAVVNDACPDCLGSGLPPALLKRAAFRAYAAWANIPDTPEDWSDAANDFVEEDWLPVAVAVLSVLEDTDD